MKYKFIDDLITLLTLPPGLRRDIISLHRMVQIHTQTEKMLRDTGCRLFETHKPDPDMAYHQGLVNLEKELSAKYGEKSVREELKEYLGEKIYNIHFELC